MFKKLFVLPLILSTFIFGSVFADNFSDCQEDVDCAQCIEVSYGDYYSCIGDCGCDEYDEECLGACTPECEDSLNAELDECYFNYGIGTESGGGIGGGDDSGDFGDDDNNGGILQNGLSSLSPVINSIKGIMTEIIPYIVYIGLGVLGAVLGFVAIKWLIAWVRSKVYGSFRR